MRSDSSAVPDNARIGAVMILLHENQKEWHTILIRRTEDGNTHSGQISFPGGKKDDSDESIEYTAIRECEEEIGILQKDIEVIGCLTPLYIPPSNFLVTPTIGILHHLQQFKLSEREVKEVIKVPLSVLFQEGIKVTHRVQRSDYKHLDVETPVYKLSEDIIIWGATAMMIAELEYICKELL